MSLEGIRLVGTYIVEIALVYRALEWMRTVGTGLAEIGLIGLALDAIGLNGLDTSMSLYPLTRSPYSFISAKRQKDLMRQHGARLS